MVLINSVLLLWMIFCLSYSFVAGSRCCLCGLRVQTEPGDHGSTQTPLNPPSLLLSSSHPCPPPHPTPPVHLFIFSSPPSHPLSVQMVDCGIISSLLACLYDALQHPAPIHTSDHSSRAAGGGRGGRGGKKKKKERGWQRNALDVSHICACQSLHRNRGWGVMCTPRPQSWATNKLQRTTNYRSNSVTLFLWQSMLVQQTGRP